MQQEKSPARPPERGVREAQHPGEQWNGTWQGWIIHTSLSSVYIRLKEALPTGSIHNFSIYVYMCIYVYTCMYICVYIYISPQRTPLDPLKLFILIILRPFGCTGPSETCSTSSNQLLTLGNALQPKK